MLLIDDEVATGFGRTGTLFASEQCGGGRARPAVLGKGITGGYLPMSATVVAGRVSDAFGARSRHLSHGHSYSGNALAAAVALRHLRLLDERRVLANVAARADQLRRLLDERVRPLDGVLEIRLRGLMGGVDVAGGADGGRRVCAAATRAGVLLRPLGERRAHAAAHHHRGRGRAHRRRPGRRPIAD